MECFARFLAGIVVSVFALPGLLYAGSLSISPTTIELPAEGGTAALYLVNHSNQPIMAQVESFGWRQIDGKDQLEPSQALQVSPPIARVAAGARQTIRIQVSPNTDPVERTFRLLVSELPDPQTVVPQGIHVRLQISIPVFVGNISTTASALSWHAVMQGDHLAIHVRNDGLTRAKLKNLHLINADGHQFAIAANGLNYVLAGSSRHWVISAQGLKVGEKLRIKGFNELGATGINASVLVGR